MVNIFIKILERILRLLLKHKLLENIFKSNFSRRVLVSYITSPLVSKKNENIHTNKKEFLSIVEIFHDLGYSVDVIDFNINIDLNFSKYDLIFGFGETFENSFHKISFKGKRIYYATGAHVFWQNCAEIRRVLNFNKSRNTNLTPKRVVQYNWSISTSMSDAIIVLGNSWTAATYQAHSDLPIYQINATGSFHNIKTLPFRDIQKCRKSFLWFGSTGLIHKGLDICLDFFSRHNDIDLHVCGPIEDDFFNLYHQNFKLSNIFYHGFVDTESELFQQIIAQCLFSIMPSCSEGQSTALLTTMGTGLIPIATKETGIDIDKFGFMLDEISSDAISRVVNVVNLLSDDTLLKMSNFVFIEIQTLHSLDSFKSRFKEILSKFHS